MVRRPRRKRHRISKKKVQSKGSRGGIPFFFTLASLLLLLLLNVNALPLLWDNRASDNLVYSIAGLSIGLWAGYVFMHGKINVFVHEFKHALLSGLVGNKATGLTVARDTGLFTYEHSRADAKYNALIALAPYCLHLFTVPAIGLGWLLFSEDHQRMIMAVGIGFGCDLLMNFREVSPVQTDISQITGGYGVGVLFIIAYNLTVATFVVAWFFQDIFGIKVLFANLWDFGLHVYYYFINR